MNVLDDNNVNSNDKNNNNYDNNTNNRNANRTLHGKLNFLVLM